MKKRAVHWLRPWLFPALEPKRAYCNIADNRVRHNTTNTVLVTCKRCLARMRAWGYLKKERT